MWMKQGWMKSRFSWPSLFFFFVGGGGGILMYKWGKSGVLNLGAHWIDGLMFGSRRWRYIYIPGGYFLG